MIRLSAARRAGLPIQTTSHSAAQADGLTNLEPVGETHINLSHGKRFLKFDALVVKNLGSEVLAGMPFMKENSIKLDIPNDQISIGNTSIHYDIPSQNQNTLNRAGTVYVLRSDQKRIILPGLSATFDVPTDISSNNVDIAYQPRRLLEGQTMWPEPDVQKIMSGKITIPNNTNEPITILANQHVADIYHIIPDHALASISSNTENIPTINCNDIASSSGPQRSHFSATVSVDPDDQLTPSTCDRFHFLHRKYDNVFNPIIGQYNDYSGPVRASINIGPVEPPTNKARMPYYNTDNLSLLQAKADELEQLGVLGRPEDLGIQVVHISPSFLITKPSGGSRFVTSFFGLANFARSPPSRVTRTDDVLRFLARWKKIIKTDMTQQFYQLAMRISSLKYLGVMTPYKGVRVYRRAAMGMPGSSEHLDELMSRVLGDLMHEGTVCKLADDLYVGGNSDEDLLVTWEKILHKFELNNLKLSASKTFICPQRATVLGWCWSSGNISASPHKVSPLITANPPLTVKGLRSWVGAFKHLKSCIKNYSSILGPLEAATGKRQSAERIEWTDTLKSEFGSAQNALQSIKSITVPNRTDQLIITTDASIRNRGLGAVLFVLRDGKMKLGGFFSAKLKECQIRWLPCELEALAISAAVEHWKIPISDSLNPTQILSDSKPCIQAYRKLCAGEFSASARITTFLSTMSQYRLILQHISGVNNLPADYASRNPSPPCEDSHCQVCTFVDNSATATVRSVSVDDILSRKSSMPFLSTTAWKQTQLECRDLRKIYSYLKTGNRPPKRATKIRDIRTYLRVASISRRDGMLVVQKDVPFSTPLQLIIVPRHILPGLLTALHLRLSHPSTNQLKKAFDRHFFALNSEDALKSTTKLCAHCESLSTLPSELPEFSTSEHPPAPGITFAADVMRRSGQYIFVTRDYFSSFTTACICLGEDHESLRDALIQTTSVLKTGGMATVRVDGASGLQTLVDDKILNSYGLRIEVGRLKNINKNPVAEKAIKELELELKKSFPGGETLTLAQLSIVLHTLNSRIGNRGLRAYEVVFQRDFISGSQLKFDDTKLADLQFQNRVKNHGPSAKCKAPKGRKPVLNKIKPGTLVYVKSEGSKHTARDRYLVTALSGEFVLARKMIGSQFRSKEYKLKPTEIFPVPSNTRNNDSEIIYSESEPDNDQATYSSDEDTSNRPPPAPNLYLSRLRNRVDLREPQNISRDQYDRE